MLGSIIGGIGSIVGGLFGKKSSDDAAEKNAALQKEFAQNGIQWKVADAKKAGLHPLAALGAQTASFSPSFVGDTSLGTGIASAGQDLGRAIDATRNPGEKLGAYQKTAADLSLQRMELENTLLASQIAKVNQVGSTPPLPNASQRWLMDGQGETALPAHPTGHVERGKLLVSDQPLERVVSNPANPSQEPGAITDVGFIRTPTGYAPVPSSDAKQRIDDDMFGTVMWNMRNRLLPSFQSNRNPPFPAPEGKAWSYNPVKQEYYLEPKYRRYEVNLDNIFN